MRLYFLTFLFVLALSPLRSQNVEDRPKLVVGIVVDQMRYDYLIRFWDKYGNDGFKRLVENGYSFQNTHFNYVPTYTGPGHASVFTGTNPMAHGIISNSWYNKFENRFVYCVGDETVKSVGTPTRAGEMSPRRMVSTTFGDENRLHTQMRGKTIGVAIKDRGAILPAGHSANGAYWFNGGDEGNFITSTYYMEELPKWVKEFNESGKAESYLKPWNTLRGINTYVESGSDENNFEGGFAGKETTTFPYDLEKLAPMNGNFELIKSTPYGNDLTADFAMAAIEGEQLGKDEDTDVLTLSFSSTDYIGHNFGVNSKEVQDTYLRLDKTIGDFLEFLDEKVGEGEYIVFLTADHGAVDVPNYLKSAKIPAGYFDAGASNKMIEDFSKEEFNTDGLIANISNNQVFLDYDKIEEADLERDDVEEKIAHFLLQQKNISRVFTREQLQSASYNNGMAELVQNGFNQKRSGDIVFVLDPGYINYSETGSTHGSGFSYDTHAPLIFYGKGIKKGSTHERAEIKDIAPTISGLLGISSPNAATGKPLIQILDQ